jgi:SH3-like domain-containing protein
MTKNFSRCAAARGQRKVEQQVPRSTLARTALAALVLFLPLAAAADDAPDPQTTGSVGASGLPLPRFVSLKSGRVNSRIGPGVNYPVDWLYLKSGLPMEIIQEFDNWRKVRDSDGAEGWINQSLLSGKRTGLAAPWQRGKAAQLQLLGEPAADAAVVVEVEPGVVGKIMQCNGKWCQMNFDGHKGWMRQDLVWGAYPGESIKD